MSDPRGSAATVEDTSPAARWVATKNGKVVAEATAVKALLVRLREPDLAAVRGIVIERRAVAP